MNVPASCVASLLALVTFGTAGAQSPNPCRAADAQSARVIEELRRIAGAPGVEGDEDRAIFGVPVAPDSAIFVITDSAVCQRLVEARAEHFRARGFTPPATASIYAIAVGAKYALFDPDGQTAGEFTVVYLYDEQFRPAGGWTGP
jgi:hypothetical protein